MKKFLLLFMAVVTIFSARCLAQASSQISSDKMDKTVLNPGNELAVTSYHVEEKINMNFGGRTTTYNVPSLELVDSNELGANNTRVVTPKYARAKTPGIANELTKPTVVPVPIKAQVTVNKEDKHYADINVMRTYERVLEKGYMAEDMLTKVADWRFLNGYLEIAAKWYSELFCINENLDAVYYYRYAESLKAIGEIEKAKEMMTLFEAKKTAK